MQFAGAVPGHGVRRHAVQAVDGLPGLGFEATQPEFQREADAARLLDFFDVGVDARREGFEDLLGVGGVAFVFDVQVAAITEQAGLDVALDGARSEDFRQPALAGSLPKLHLEEAILCNHEALREEQIVLILGVNVGDSPAVTLHAHTLLKAAHAEGSANHRYGCFCAGLEVRGGSLR